MIEAKPLKTKLTDLHEILFEQLERLNNPDLKGAELDEEIKRGHAVSSISAQIIQNGNLAIKALTAKLDIPANETLPNFLEIGAPERCAGSRKN